MDRPYSNISVHQKVRTHRCTFKTQIHIYKQRKWTKVFVHDDGVRKLISFLVRYVCAVVPTTTRVWVPEKVFYVQIQSNHGREVVQLYVCGGLCR